MGGTVTGRDGNALEGVWVVLNGQDGVLVAEVQTEDNGRFAFQFLEAGSYNVLFELIGYQPKRVIDLPVRANGNVTFNLILDEVEPPVMTIDTVITPAGALQGSRAGMSQWFAPFAVTRLPGDQRREITDLVRLSSISAVEFATEGLPAGLSGFRVDGIPYDRVTHPGVDQLVADGALFPRSGFSTAELIHNGTDVEWSEFGGGVLSGHSARGDGVFRFRAFGDWMGDVVNSSKYFDPSAASLSTLRGGAMASGPLVRDTAAFAVGIEASMEEHALPPAWEGRLFDEALVGVGTDSFAVDLAPLTRPRVVSTEVIAGFGRLDWKITDSHRVALRANAAVASVRQPDFGPYTVQGAGSDVDGVDVSVGGGLVSTLSRILANELRVGFEAGDRDYGASSLPSTTVVGPAIRFGTDVGLPGSFSRTSVRALETVHVDLGRIRLKLGAGLTVSSHSLRRDLSTPRFVFADLDAFAAGRGSVSRIEGSSSAADYTSVQLAFFIQDTWQAAPGLHLTFGLRYERESLPSDEVVPSSAWLDRTGLDNSVLDAVENKFSPRFAFDYIDSDQRWSIRGELGAYYDLVDPGVFGELIANVGTNEFGATSGDLSSWPSVPSGAITTVGPRITLLGPQYEAPRTVRVGIGLSRSLGATAALHLSGTYRHTDFLPRRSDVNRALGSGTTDQYGRQLFGDLVKDGAAIAAIPGSNRRFGEFDLVSAINADGASDYWGITASLEKHLGDDLAFYLSYTYSETRDNRLSLRGGGLEDQLNPFPDSLAGRDWADGTSDLDVPNRLVAGLDFRLPRLRQVRLSAFYRFQSGFPFTPGFRYGVDANGDGSARNDPAFVDPDVDGVDELLARWPCLRRNVGRFTTRNVCRGPNLHTLDLRLGIALREFVGIEPQLVVEGVNLLETNLFDVDNALYLVDETQALGIDLASGITTVPLVANPGFGSALVRRTRGKFFRAGLRLEY